MNKMLLAGLLALGLAHGAGAVELTWIDTDKSSLSFVFHEMGVPITGHFKRFSAQLRFDPAQATKASAALDLDLASIDAGSDEANDEVVGPLWFNTKDFPQARFVASSVKALGGNRYSLSGKLTIKGHTQPIEAPFTFTPDAAGGAFDGAFALKRADFAIGEGMWADYGTVANDIQIQFHLAASARK